MMSPYFKIYIIGVFNRHRQDFVISIILYFITMYFVLIRSELASGVGACSILFLIFIKKFESKSFAQSNLNFRTVEQTLLPLTAQEMFYSQFFKVFITTFPVYFIVLGIVPTFAFDVTKISLLQLICYEFIASILLILISVTASLRVSFVKIKKIHKLTSMTRFMNYTFIITGVFLAGIAMNKFYKTNVPGILIYFSVLSLFVVYLGGNVENKFLHEHKIYINKKFKWFDIPGMVIIVFVIVSCLYSMTQPARSPSSISKETIRK